MELQNTIVRLSTATAACSPTFFGDGHHVFDEKSNLRSASVLGDRHHVFDEGLRDSKSNLCFATVLGDRHHVCDKKVVRRQISNLRFATVLGDQHHVCYESVVQRQKMNPIIFQGKPCHKSYHERTRIYRIS